MPMAVNMHKPASGTGRLLALLLACALLFTGCTAEKSPDNEAEKSPDNEFFNFKDRIPVDYSYVIPRTPQEYYTVSFDGFVNWDAFISYDMLRKYFGDFRGFSFSSYETQAIPDIYDYSFGTEDHTRYRLTIYESPKHYDPSDFDGPHAIEIDDVPNKNDLRSGIVPSEYWLAYYYVGNIQYCYVDHEVEYITWNTETHQFLLSLYPDWSEYDPEDGSFLSRLLREETAEAAVAEFNAHIDRCLAFQKLIKSAGN